MAYRGGRARSVGNDQMAHNASRVVSVRNIVVSETSYLSSKRFLQYIDLRVLLTSSALLVCQR